MDTATLTLVLTLALASIVMVLAMVRFSVALIAEPGRPSAVKGWGLLYAATWGVITVVLLRFVMNFGGTPWPQALAAVIPWPFGWGTFQAFWVWLWLSIERANAREAGDADALAPAREALCWRAGQLALGGLIFVALAVIALDGTRAAIAELLAPDNRALTATLTVAAAGFVLFMIGTVRGVIKHGKPMSHAEIEEDIGRTKYGAQGRTGPLTYRASTYRHFGPAVGAKFEEEVSISEVKGAWRSGAWRRDLFWQTVSMMAAGVVMMVFGGFGAVLVAGSLSAKIICGGALGYVTYQLITAFRRA
jgi:hypothetical protein